MSPSAAGPVLSLILLAASSEKVPLSMRKMCGFTLSYALARSHLCLCSVLIHPIVSNSIWTFAYA